MEILQYLLLTGTTTSLIGIFITKVFEYFFLTKIETKKLGYEITKMEHKEILDKKKLIWERKFPLYKEMYNDFVDIYVELINCPKNINPNIVTDIDKDLIKSSIDNTIKLLIKIIKYGPLLDKDYFSKLEIKINALRAVIGSTQLHIMWMADKDMRQTITGKEIKEYYDVIQKFDKDILDLRDELASFIAKEIE